MLESQRGALEMKDENLKGIFEKHRIVVEEINQDGFYQCAFPAGDDVVDKKNVFLCDLAKLVDSVRSMDLLDVFSKFIADNNDERRFTLCVTYFDSVCNSAEFDGDLIGVTSQEVAEEVTEVVIH